MATCLCFCPDAFPLLAWGILTLTEQNLLDFYGSPYSGLFFIASGGIYVIALLYNIFWLQRQLKQGISEERTEKNFSAKSSIYSKKTLIPMFIVIMVSRFLIQGSALRLFGLGITPFFLIVFSRLHIEYAYAAILKWRDKTYWETYKPEDGFVPNKTFYWGLFTLLELLVIVGIGQIGQNLDNHNVWVTRFLGILMIAILLDWLIRLIRYFTKRKDENDENG